MGFLDPLSPEEIAQNRAILLYHLRVNPNNVRQITGVLKHSEEAMCAVGLACDAFSIPMTAAEKMAEGIHLSETFFSPYKILAHKVGVPEEVVTALYGLNDNKGLSFEEVAQVADLYFKSDQSKSPWIIWRELQEEN